MFQALRYSPTLKQPRSRSSGSHAEGRVGQLRASSVSRRSPTACHAVRSFGDERAWVLDVLGYSQALFPEALRHRLLIRGPGPFIEAEILTSRNVDSGFVAINELDPESVARDSHTGEVQADAFDLVAYMRKRAKPAYSQTCHRSIGAGHKLKASERVTSAKNVPNQVADSLVGIPLPGIILCAREVVNEILDPDSAKERPQR